MTGQATQVPARTGDRQPVEAGSEPWHTLVVDAVVDRLVTNASTGLTSAEAANRLALHGPNELQAARVVPPWKLFLAQFRNVLVIILLVAVGLSLALGHLTEAIVITAIVVLAAVLGFVQEYRAERAIEALGRMAAPVATVIRDGDEIDLPAREVVPGDLLVLRAGDRISADGRLVEAVNLQVEESALTGESVPVEKQLERVEGRDSPIGDRSNMVFAGTSVSYGRGRALVTETAMATEFGAVARMLDTIERAKTPLQVSLDRVAVLLARAAIVIVGLVMALGFVRGEPFVEVLLFGTALAVAVVPEALPAVLTISLTLAAQKMARRNALVRRLSAVETLGSVSVICSDKTGTLTKNEMTVRRVFAGGESFELSGSGYGDGGVLRDGDAAEPTAALLETLRGAALASDATLVVDDDAWEVRGNPTEGALLVAAAKVGIRRDELDERFPRVDEIPFTSEAKRMTTIHETADGRVAYAKGAPEVILDSCSRVLSAAGEDELDSTDREAIVDAARAMADQALRVLAVARRADASHGNAESDMTFLGLVGMIDPPRPEARDAVATCVRAGIVPVMITGDHPATAAAIARELGILKTGRAVTGAELDAMDDDQLVRQINDIEVYARVSPEHKLRVVTALQGEGHTVAMTGDGVNDAPALKKADIGVAMGITGTDVAKEAAAMTLTDDNFASIVAAVEAGRGVFANIRKYLMYLLAANLGEIVLLLGASLLGRPLPLSAVQILYVNLATDGLPALALSVDPNEDDLMTRPPRSRRTGIFTRPVVTLLAVGGVWSGLATLTLFLALLESGTALEEAMTVTFATLVAIEFFKAYAFRSDRHSIARRPFANKWLNIAVIWEVALLMLVLHVPFLQEAFGTEPLSPEMWLLAMGTAFTIIPVLEIAKRVVHRPTLSRHAAAQA